MLMRKIEQAFWLKQLEQARECFKNQLVTEGEKHLEKAYGEAVWHLRYFVSQAPSVDALEEIAFMVHEVFEEANANVPGLASEMFKSYEIELQWVYVLTGIDLNEVVKAKQFSVKSFATTRLLGVTIKSWFGHETSRLYHSKKRLRGLVTTNLAYPH